MKSNRDNLLIWLAGGDPQVLRECTTAEYRKYVKLGIVILIPAALAWFSMWFVAPYLGLGSWGAIALSTLWASVVLAIDTYLVSTLDKNQLLSAPAKYYGVAAVRLVISIVIGIIISHPLVLKILERRIDNEVRLMKNEELVKVQSDYRDSARAWTAQLQRKDDSVAREIKRVERLQEAELNGVSIRTDSASTRGIPGQGPSYRRLTELLANLRAQHAQLGDSVKAGSDQTMDRATRLVADLDSTYFPDYLTRTIGLSRLSRYSATTWLVWCLIIFLVLIDSSAVLFKIISPRSESDRMLLELSKAKERKFVSSVSQDSSLGGE